MHKFGGKKPSGKLQPGHIVPFSRTNIFSGFRLATSKGRTPVTCRGRDREARGFACVAKWACPQISQRLRFWNKVPAELV